MDIVIMAAQLILGLSLLVGVHELGHMLAAKAFGMRVEKYAIGFPPKIWSKQIGETEYSVGALLLGGFVKISGMIDESLDTSQMKSEPQPWEFRAKPAWQRLIVMLGGIIVNVLTGMAIFISLVFLFGESYLSKDEVNRRGVYVNAVGEKLGLRKGDQIVEINGKPFDNFSDAGNISLLLEEGSSYTVVRNGERMKVSVPSDFLNELSRLSEEEKEFLRPLTPFRVGEVAKGGAAHAAGLKAGDSIVALNGFPIGYFEELTAALRQHKGDTVQVAVLRGGKEQAFDVAVDDKGRLGIYIEDLLPRSTLEYGLGGSLVRGTEKAFGVIVVQLKAFRKIFKGDVNASDALSGPLGMAKIYGSEWDWGRFWTITGMLSMVLAFMNLLPIPALDGGHVVFLSYEMISGRPPADKFLENAQKVGMLLLLSLMAFAIGSDIYKSDTFQGILEWFG
jgi:regulator of sigma E protease